MFSYRLIVKKAWDIAWQHKYLWLLGLFASIVAASGTFEFQFLSNSFQSGALENPYYYLNTILISLESLGLFLLGLVNLFSYNILTILNTLTVLIIVAAILISFTWLSVSSQAGLVVASEKIGTSKRKVSDLSIRKLITAGHKNFWSVLGLNVLINVAVVFILSIISLPLLILSAKYSISLSFLYTLAFIVFIPLAIAFSLMIKYAIAFKVLEGDSFLDSLKNSWDMFTENWLVSLEMGIILFLISFVVGFIIILLLYIFILPYFIFALDYGLIPLIVILAILAFFLVLAVGSFLTTFQIAAWTNIYVELKNGNGQAKLERVFAKKGKKIST